MIKRELWKFILICHLQIVNIKPFAFIRVCWVSVESLKGYKRPSNQSLTHSHSHENPGIFSCLHISDNSDCGQFQDSRVWTELRRCPKVRQHQRGRGHLGTEVTKETGGIFLFVQNIWEKTLAFWAKIRKISLISSKSFKPKLSNYILLQNILSRFQFWIRGSWETWRDPLLAMTRLPSETMESWNRLGPMSMTWSWWDLWCLSKWTAAPMFTLMDWWGRWDPSEMRESWGH